MADSKTAKILHTLTYTHLHMSTKNCVIKHLFCLQQQQQRTTRTLSKRVVFKIKILKETKMLVCTYVFLFGVDSDEY